MVTESENEGGREHIEFCGAHGFKNFQGSATLVGEFAVSPLCRYIIYRLAGLPFSFRDFAERPGRAPETLADFASPPEIALALELTILAPQVLDTSFTTARTTGSSAPQHLRPPDLNLSSFS